MFPGFSVITNAEKNGVLILAFLIVSLIFYALFECTNPNIIWNFSSAWGRSVRPQI